MPRLTHRLPKLRRHKTGQAFVRISGRHIYLGKHGTARAREAYDQIIAEWIAAGRAPIAPGPGEQPLSLRRQ